jgi:F0F1-type ATP synthase membrane subunit c/vacuolar-type H+-ATPase subunit K
MCWRREKIKEFNMSANEVKHPQGYWISVGISLGIAIGVGFGLILGNLGAGIGIGVALGTAMGASLEHRNKNKLRPLTGLEVRRQWRSISIGLVLVIVLAIILTIIFLLQAT